MKLILASGSPRRKELLEGAGLDFEVIPSPAVEVHDASLGMAGLCEENARLKASSVSENHPGALVIGADTLVFLDGMPLGKPKSLEEAAGMLGNLSGRTHQVCSGVCFCGPGGEVRLFHGVTEVTFKELADSDIENYLARSSPLDKAGGYGIQDHGEMIVESISGEYENVMGLPLRLVLERLREIRLPSGRR